MQRIFHNIDQNSDEWYELRKPRITASAFEKFLMAPTTTGFKEALSNVAMARCGEDVERFAGNVITDMGHEQEPLAREAYEMETFNDIENGGFWTLGDWCGASPDGMIGDDGIWENKAKVKPNTLIKMFQDHEKGILMNEKSNKAHFWQVHFQLYVTGREWCDYQLGFSGYEPIIQHIVRDESIIKRIEDKLLEVIPLIEGQMILINKYKL